MNEDKKEIGTIQVSCSYPSSTRQQSGEGEDKEIFQNLQHSYDNSNSLDGIQNVNIDETSSIEVVDATSELSQEMTKLEESDQFVDVDNEKEQEQQQAYRQLRMLSMDRQGKFLENWNPATSKREARKINQKKNLQKGMSLTRKRQPNLYDEDGIRTLDGVDLCDCLLEKCEGCHFPCPECGSQKCGVVCRCSRRWSHTNIEIEGTQYVISARLPK